MTAVKVRFLKIEKGSKSKVLRREISERRNGRQGMRVQRNNEIEEIEGKTTKEYGKMEGVDAVEKAVESLEGEIPQTEDGTIRGCGCISDQGW